MRLVGIVFAVLSAACGQATPVPVATRPPAVATPTIRPSGGPAWVEQLTFSGEVNGLLNQVVTVDPNHTSECTGKNSRGGKAWASSIYGPIGGEVYGVVLTVSDYRGPGTYTQPQTSVQVNKPANPAAGWQSVQDDAVSFTVAADEESGTLDAQLHSLVSPGKVALKVTGRWTCRT